MPVSSVLRCVFHSFSISTGGQDIGYLLEKKRLKIKKKYLEKEFKRQKDF
jgi:hypothetical protein